MDLKTRKLNMIEYLIQLKDETFFEKIERFISSEEVNNYDFWDDLTPAQQDEIKKASLEIEGDKAIDYESFIAKHR